MTNKRRPYQTYPREFKLEALRLMDESDRPTSEIAMQLGIRRNLLYSRIGSLLDITPLAYPLHM